MKDIVLLWWNLWKDMHFTFYSCQPSCTCSIWHVTMDIFLLSLHTFIKLCTLKTKPQKTQTTQKGLSTIYLWVWQSPPQTHNAIIYIHIFMHCSMCFLNKNSFGFLEPKMNWKPALFEWCLHAPLNLQSITFNNNRMTIAWMHQTQRNQKNVVLSNQCMPLDLVCHPKSNQITFVSRP